MKEAICEEEGEIVFKDIKFAGEIISFKDGQELKVRYSKYEGENFITIEYDFGMVIRESCDKENNWFMYGYRNLDKNPSIADIVEETVIYDIEHAFCHPNCDPNYGEIHWAIKGWLKDRVEIIEDLDKINTCIIDTEGS